MLKEMTSEAEFRERMNLYVAVGFSLKPDPAMPMRVDESQKILRLVPISQPKDLMAINLWPDYQVYGSTVMAISTDEAKEKFMRELHSRFPDNEGWIAHSAEVWLISKEYMTEFLRECPMPDKKETDSTLHIDSVM